MVSRILKTSARTLDTTKIPEKAVVGQNAFDTLVDFAETPERIESIIRPLDFPGTLHEVFDTVLGLHRSCTTKVVKPLDAPRALNESLYGCKDLAGLPRITGACIICGHDMLTLEPFCCTSISSSSSEEMSLRSPGLLTPAPIAISSAYTSRIYSTAGRL